MNAEPASARRERTRVRAGSRFGFRLAGAAGLIVPVIASLLGALVPGCGKNFTPRNHAPVIKVQPDTSVALGDTLRLRAVATDEDWDQLTYKAIVRVSAQELRQGFPGKALMNFNSGKFWFTARDTTPKTICFVADDKRGGTDTTTFVVHVRGRSK